MISCGRGDRPARFFRLRGQVELQPIRQVGTHRACIRGGERKCERERERDIPRTRIRMTSFIDQSCLSHTLRLVCKTNYWKDSLPSRGRACVQNVFSIFIHARDTIVPRANVHIYNTICILLLAILLVVGETRLESVTRALYFRAGKHRQIIFIRRLHVG